MCANLVCFLKNVFVRVDNFVFCSGWFLGTWVSPSYLDYMWGTNRGTQASCTSQSFIIQLGGTTSLFFNGSLAILFFLVIRYCWRERQIRQIVVHLQLWLWVICIVASIVPLALGMYNNAGPVCWIAPLPSDCTETWLLSSTTEISDCERGDNASLAVVVMLLVPIAIVVIVDSIIMSIIYWEIRKVEKLIESERESAQPACDSSCGDEWEGVERTEMCEEDGTGSQQEIPKAVPYTEKRKDSLSGEEESRSQQRNRSKLVAQQGMLYIAGFLLTFGPTAISALYFLFSGSWSTALDRTSYFFLPLQGFWNFLIYSRRRQMKTALGRKGKTIVWEMIWGCELLKPVVSTWKKADDATQSGERLAEGNGVVFPPITGGRETETRRILCGVVAQLRHAFSRTISDLGVSTSDLSGPGMPSVGDPRWKGTAKDATPLKLPRRESSRSKVTTTYPADSPPSRPIRIKSEDVSIFQVDSDFHSPSCLAHWAADSPPLRSRRVESEARSSAEYCPENSELNIAIASGTPPLIESTAMDPANSAVQCTGHSVHQSNDAESSSAGMSPSIKKARRWGSERPPELPIRFDSEAVLEESDTVSQSTLDPPTERITLWGSEQPPVLPLRLESEVDPTR